MNDINLIDWDISYNDFVEWVGRNGCVVHAIASTNASYTARYRFENLEDLVAFKIAFKKAEAILMGYKGKTVIDTGHFYCPYIPLMTASCIPESDSTN